MDLKGTRESLQLVLRALKRNCLQSLTPYDLSRYYARAYFKGFLSTGRELIFFPLPSAKWAYGEKVEILKIKQNTDKVIFNSEVNDVSIRSHERKEH